MAKCQPITLCSPLSRVYLLHARCCSFDSVILVIQRYVRSIKRAIVSRNQQAVSKNCFTLETVKSAMSLENHLWLVFFIFLSKNLHGYKEDASPNVRPEIYYVNFIEWKRHGSIYPEAWDIDFVVMDSFLFRIWPEGRWAFIKLVYL